MVPDERWPEEEQNKCEAIAQDPTLKHELLLQGSLSISEHSISITKQ
jgi:hypothetical protein